MNANEELITNFYKAFQKKDYKTMQNYYSDDATFNDPVFQNLNVNQVKAMWEMFCIKGKKLNIEYKNIKANENEGSCEWIATYQFSKTGKNVINHIYTNFNFDNGKIMNHADSFNFYKWVSQSLGLIGLLLGWTPFIRNKIQQGALKNLNDFMANKL